MNLAIDENISNQEFVASLEKAKSYFALSKSTDAGDNGNSVAHGYMHPIFWNKESFEQLIQDIAILSKHAMF